MNLRTYLDSAGRGAGAALARNLGVKPVMVTQWAQGAKSVPVARCVAIEKATGGAVHRSTLRDDWRDHWPELDAPQAAPANASADAAQQGA